MEALIVIVPVIGASVCLSVGCMICVRRAMRRGAEDLERLRARVEVLERRPLIQTQQQPAPQWPQYPPYGYPQPSAPPAFITV